MLKVSRCRPTVSNGTILATTQEFFFTKVAPAQSITDILLLAFLSIMLPFISSNTPVYFFVKNYFFFECLYFSEYYIRMLLFVFSLRNRPSIKYVRKWGNGGGSSKMCTGAYSGRGVSRLMCKYTLTGT